MVSESNGNIHSTYYRGLKSYLFNESEQSLSEAYERSRIELQEGLSELEIIALHHQILANIVDTRPPLEMDEILEKATTYLLEWVVPYEVKLRSYRELIEQLNSTNEQLRKEIETRKSVEKELEESKNYFQSLIENAQDIITVIDHEGEIYYDTPAVNRILGYKRNELIGENAFDYIHNKDIEEVQKTFLKIIADPDQLASIEFRFRHKNGHWVYLESVANNLPDREEGSVIVINARDVTERHEHMQKLQEQETKLIEAQSIAGVGNWEWNIKGEPELEGSPEMYRIYGFDEEEFDQSYETFIQRVHPSDRKRIERIFTKAYQNKTSFSFEHKIVCPGGLVRHLFGKGEPIINEDGELVKIVGTVQDITDQKQKEEQLRKYSQRLRALSERVERTREEERTRIAREIHDELGQMLTVLKMDVSALREDVKTNESNEFADHLDEEIQKVLERINDIINSVHRITTELRPEVLDNLGFLEALEWQARELGKRIDLELEFTSHVENTDFLDDDQINTLFRIFQETMSNVLRHSQASKVEIEIMKMNGYFILTVSDDGRGITEKEKQASSSYGIIGMRERVRFLGGDVYIEGKEGKGTQVTIQLPL